MLSATASNDLWLGRFWSRSVIREGAACVVCSAHDAKTGDARVVVVARAGRDMKLAKAALTKLALAHQRLSHPRIARVVELGDHEGVPFVAFDCDAVVELGELLRAARRNNLLAPHSQADGFILGLRQALQAAHASIDAERGEPTCIGTLGYGNVLFAPDGRHWLIGFGHNVITHDERGEPLGGEPTFQALEVAVGGALSPSGDFVALLMLMRSMIPSMRFEPAVARVLIGRTLREDVELVKSILWIERRVMAASPTTRASISEAIEVSNRIRALLGIVPDPEGFERLAARSLAELLPERIRASGELKVTPDASCLEAPDGSRHELGTRRPMRLVILALVHARLTTPGAVLSVTDLVEAGWPGERPRGETGANRVYVVINSLRRMGLRTVLQRHDTGYRLAPSLRVSWLPNDVGV